MARNTEYAPNSNGSGYVCYSRAGINKPNAVHGQATTQVFEGAPDLDIGPAVGDETVLIARIWCQAGSAVTLEPLVSDPGLTFSLVDSAGYEVPLQNLKGQARNRGWYAVQVASTKTGPTPFSLAVTYTSTQFL